MEELLKLLGVEKLNPVQEKALETGFLEGKNLVVASPTGSGKTLIAEMAMLGKRKVIYTCPLRALASEKYEEFQVFEKLGKRVAISIGDLDSSDPWLEKYDIIVTTNEKLDSLMRHRAPWLGKVDLLVVDEIHLIDSDRGPTLESVIMRFRYLFPRTQILALSATIPNAEELANWLDADLVTSNWRPVRLIKGVYLDGLIETTDGTIEVEETYKDPLKTLVHHFLNEGKNILIFTPTRKSAEATAEALTSLTKRFSPPEELAEKALHALESPTKQCQRLALCLRNGSAFHHAGLVSEQRRLIERAFKENKIRVLCSTPTLAMGVNLPADVVIMKSLVRYTGHGIVKIPRREFHQCAGRAGRPQYSKEGLAVLIAKSEDEKEILWNEYITAGPEDVYSQMSREPVLRTHVLASIAMHLTPSFEKLNALFMHSFFAFQYKDMKYLEEKIKKIVEELESWGFVTAGETISPTRIGSRVSELYIDPYSAYKMIQAIRTREPGEMGWLYIIVNTEEMKPYLGIRRREEESVWDIAVRSEEELGIDPVKASFEDYYFLEKFKTAMMLKDWINECTEEEILEKYNVAPGILRAYISNAEWMVYSAGELARLIGEKKKASFLKGFRRRIVYGVKEELLPLVELKGIGRIKARRLYNMGIKKKEDIKYFENKKMLENAIGRKTLEKILEDEK